MKEMKIARGTARRIRRYNIKAFREAQFARWKEDGFSARFLDALKAQTAAQLKDMRD